MHYDFAVQMTVDGTTQRRQFSVSAIDIKAAIQETMRKMMQEHPNAEFAGLTYFHPPLPCGEETQQ